MSWGQNHQTIPPLSKTQHQKPTWHFHCCSNVSYRLHHFAQKGHLFAVSCAAWLLGFCDFCGECPPWRLMYRRKGCKHCHCSSRDSIANTRKYCASNKGNITTRQQKELVSLNTIWICNFLRQDATNAMQIKYFSLYMMQLMLRECLLQDAALFDKQEIQGLKCCKYYANIRFVAPNKRV